MDDFTLSKNLYWFWDGEIPEIICDAIIAEGEKGLTEGKVGKDEGVVDQSVRNSKIKFILEDGWINAIAKHYMEKANNQAWRFDIRGQQDPQFTKYEVGQFYDFHRDSSMVDDGMRKLSMSILLSEPGKDFSGGEFELDSGIFPALTKRGSILVFPSFLRHRVKPVTYGVRYSLVNWFTGPALV